MLHKKNDKRTQQEHIQLNFTSKNEYNSIFMHLLLLLFVDDRVVDLPRSSSIEGGFNLVSDEGVQSPESKVAWVPPDFQNKDVWIGSWCLFLDVLDGKMVVFHLGNPQVF